MLSNLMNTNEHNHTNTVFQLLPFNPKPNGKLLNVIFFSTIYFLGIIMNSAVFAVICLDSRLHTPMYLFFCNLSAIDIWCTIIIVPKLLYILLSGNDLVSFTQCFTQIYFFLASVSAEVILLFVLGYDRYVAICHPLHYNHILSMKNCKVIMGIMWIVAFINALLVIFPLLNLTFDRVNILHQFFCDSLSVFLVSYGGSNEFLVVLCIEMVLLGLCPFLCNVVSYIKIVRVTLRIKSREGRRKTFSTCSSHIIVMTIYYCTGASHIFSTFHHKGDQINSQVLSIFYTIIVPTINPLVYSLRNKEIKKAIQRLLKVK